MSLQTFDAAIHASHDALRAMASGDPGPTLALWSDRDDILLANPLGLPIVGRQKVSAEVQRVAAAFAGSDSFAFEQYTKSETGDLGYLSGIERARVRRVGSNDVTEMALRVTTIFRREADGWRLVLRHADRVPASA